MSIVLIGYRGSGKTTLGRRLAAALGWSFVDLDEQIVKQNTLSIKTIFENVGEAGFRQLETACFLKVIELKNHVISLGGGSVLASKNQNALKLSGHKVVYLWADAAELHQRISADPATAQHRPALTKLNGSAEEIQTLLNLREPIYQQVADFELDVAGKNIESLVAQLVALVG